MSVNRRQKERQEARRASARAWADKQQTGFEPRTVQLPEGTSWFSTQDPGTYEIDIIPYVAGPGNPSADEGMVHFERTFHVHWKLGLDGKDRYCCLAKTFGRPCPVCDWLRTQDEEIRKKMSPSPRCLWRVIDRKNPKKGIQAWETSYKLGFGEGLAHKLKASRRYDNFSDLQGGMWLEVLMVKKPNGSGGTFTTPASIDMIPRDEDYPDSLIDEGFNPDLCIIPPRPKHLKDKPVAEYTKADWKAVYDHYKAIMWGDRPDEDEEGRAVATTDDDDDAPPAKKPTARKPVPADDEDDVPPAKKPAGRKPAPVEEDDDEEPAPKKPAAKRPAPVEDDEDEEEAPPTRKPAARKPAPADDLDDEDEAPPAKKPAVKRPVADDDEDDAPAARNGTAGKTKYKVGDWVIYNDQPHVITAINAATGVITIEDDDGEDYRVKPEKLTPCPKPSGR